MTDPEFLEELFKYEDCNECGKGEEGHLVSDDPLGNLHAWCIDPVE